jgi:large subunit ribosomal protein L18
MNNSKKKIQDRTRRRARIRAKISGTKDMPRLSVFRSGKFIYAQVVDDEQGVTLVASSDLKAKKGTKTDRAKAVGQQIAEMAKAKGITKVVFDRGGFLYRGRVASLADGAREGGLTF